MGAEERGVKPTKSYQKWYKKNWMCVADEADAIHIWKAAWKRGAKEAKRNIPQVEPQRS
jgi:hypothetical protein